MVTGTIYVLDNTLDLVCATAPGQIMKVDVVQPGLSDHHYYIVSATLIINLIIALSQPKIEVCWLSVKCYNKAADKETFQMHLKAQIKCCFC